MSIVMQVRFCCFISIVYPDGEYLKTSNNRHIITTNEQLLLYSFNVLNKSHGMLKCFPKNLHFFIIFQKPPKEVD